MLTAMEIMESRYEQKNDTPRKCTGVPRVGTLKSTLKQRLEYPQQTNKFCSPKICKNTLKLKFLKYQRRECFLGGGL